MKKKQILVVVYQGIANVIEDTVPDGYRVRIVDLDAIKVGDELLTPEAAKAIRRLGLRV